MNTLTIVMRKPDGVSGHLHFTSFWKALPCFWMPVIIGFFPLIFQFYSSMIGTCLTNRSKYVLSIIFNIVFSL